MLAWIILFLVIVLIGVLLVRTFTFSSRQLRGVPADELKLDLDGAVKRLTGAIQIKTLSFAESGEVDSAPFGEFHA